MATPKGKESEEEVVTTIAHSTACASGDSEERRGKKPGTMATNAHLKWAYDIEDREPHTGRSTPRPREEDGEPDPPGGIIERNGRHRGAGGGGVAEEQAMGIGTATERVKTGQTPRRTRGRAMETARAKIQKTQTRCQAGSGSGTTCS